MNSTPLQRLKKIAQFGMPDNYAHIKSYSRYEHSVGVMLVLRKLGASEEEQIAGLLHDVSHTAFSHVVDWVVGEGKVQDFQDNHHKLYIERTDIPEILKSHGYVQDRIVNYGHFTLLELPLPGLCADRLDYSLREFPPNIYKTCVDDLTVFEDKIVFKNKESALLFANHFLQRQIENWGGFESAARYRIFANVLKHAMQKEIISMKDLWEYDDFVVKKLLLSNDPYILSTLHELEQNSLSHLPQSNQKIYTKFRYVDPCFIKNGTVIALSSVSNQFQDTVKKAKEQNEQGFVLPEMKITLACR